MRVETPAKTEAKTEFRSRVASRRGRSKRWIAGLSAVAMMGAAMGLGAGTAQASCAQGIESGTYAKSVRTLQSDMMVAALSCNERALYNNFAVTYRPDLLEHGKALKAHFKATHGGAATRKLNAYVTELANDASIRHARTGQDYCATAKEVFMDLIGTEGRHDDLGAYALRYAIAVRPQIAQEIAVAAGGDASCDEIVALNEAPAE